MAACSFAGVQTQSMGFAQFPPRLEASVGAHSHGRPLGSDFPRSLACVTKGTPDRCKVFAGSTALPFTSLRTTNFAPVRFASISSRKSYNSRSSFGPSPKRIFYPAWENQCPPTEFASVITIGGSVVMFGFGRPDSETGHEAPNGAIAADEKVQNGNGIKNSKKEKGQAHPPEIEQMAQAIDDEKDKTGNGKKTSTEEKRQAHLPTTEKSRKTVYMVHMTTGKAGLRPEEKFIIQRKFLIDCLGSEEAYQNSIIHHYPRDKGRVAAWLTEKQARALKKRPGVYLTRPFT